MKIGVIGTGNMGRALGVRWARGGHRVLFGSRESGQGPSGCGELLRPGRRLRRGRGVRRRRPLPVRDVLPSSLLRSPQALAGKIVIDCNNSAVLGLDLPESQSAEPALISRRLFPRSPNGSWPTFLRRAS